MDFRFNATKPGDNPPVIEANLGSAQRLPVQHASGKEPRRDADSIQVVQSLDLEAGIEKELAEPRPGVATKMIERAIERAIDRGHSRDEQQQRAVTRERATRGAQKIRVTLDVLHDIDGDDGVCPEGVADFVEVPLEDANAGVARKPPLQLRDIVPGRLDEKEGFGGGPVQDQLGDGTDSGPGLGDPLAECAGKGVDDPIVVIGGLGDGIQLGAGIGEISNGGVGRRVGGNCNLAWVKIGG